MSFRTVVISRQSKISYKNRFLVVKKDNDEKYVHLSEIDTIIVDSISVSISTYLLKELSDNKINIIFCDDKHNPFGELSSYYSRHNSSKKIKEQITWKVSSKDELWSRIVKNKIINQALLLRKIKSALNYGYAILLSTVNKEVISNGYLTQLGIHHKNEFNQFNLTCDLMEPFRIIIDNFVYYNQNRKLDKDYKLDIVNIFNNYFLYQNKKYILKDIIKMYIKNTLDCIDNLDNYKEFVYYEG